MSYVSVLKYLLLFPVFPGLHSALRRGHTAAVLPYREHTALFGLSRLHAEYQRRSLTPKHNVQSKVGCGVNHSLGDFI